MVVMKLGDADDYKESQNDQKKTQTEHCKKKMQISSKSDWKERKKMSLRWNMSKKRRKPSWDRSGLKEMQIEHKQMQREKRNK